MKNKFKTELRQCNPSLAQQPLKRTEGISTKAQSWSSEDCSFLLLHPPPTFGLFITLIQSGDTSDTAPCKNLSTGVSGIMEGSRGGGRNSSLIS